MNVVKLSDLRTDRLYPPVNISGTHFCYRLYHPQSHSAAGRIMSIKNYNDTIGNRTRDLPTCIVVFQPTALPRAPKEQEYFVNTDTDYCSLLVWNVCNDSEKCRVHLRYKKRRSAFSKMLVYKLPDHPILQPKGQNK
jgi:hypothetical protein